MSPRPHSHPRILAMICFGFTALLVVLYLFNGLYQGRERAARDWLMNNSKDSKAVSAQPDSQIVFLAIDDVTRTLDTLFADDLEKSSTLRLMKKGFPWDRTVEADIVNRLADAGAKAVVFDMVFPSERDGDEAFREALEKHPNLAVIGTKLDQKGDAFQDILPSPTLLPNSSLQDPRMGFVNVTQDPDGIVRRVSYRTTPRKFFKYPPKPGEPEVFSLAASALRQAGFANSIPEGLEPRMIRFQQFESHSLYEIFVEPQWNGPPYNKGELFEDKIVFIGDTGQSSEDRVQTPGGISLGALVQLNAINAAINHDYLRETSPQVDLSSIIGAGVMAFVLGLFIRTPVWRLLVLAAITFGYLLLMRSLVNHWGLLLLPVGPPFVFLASGITASAWEQILDRLERQRTRKTLDRYVGREVVREILDNPSSFINTVGGTRKNITVLFSDIRGFTARTETSDPKRLVTQLNEYFEAMVAIVVKHRGTLDKFIGDAVMAHWGSFLSDGAAVDAERAVTAVLEMQVTLRKLNVGWEARGFEPLYVGFGINNGDAIMASLGSENKSEITAIGDAVNLGSRLEGVTKKYRLDICIGETVADLVRDKFILRSLDLIIVQGKTKPVEIFTVIGKRGETPEPDWLAKHEEATELYRAGKFAEAESIWNEILTKLPEDGVAKVFLGRCAELRNTPPAAPWTGVYEMKSK